MQDNLALLQWFHTYSHQLANSLINKATDGDSSSIKSINESKPNKNIRIKAP